MNALREDRGRRGGRPDRGRRRLQPASRRLDRRRCARLAGHVPIAGRVGLAIHAHRRAPGFRRGSRRRQRCGGRDPAGGQPDDPAPSCPASRSRSRRVGSTAATRPVSTRCSRTRPPMRPSTLPPASFAQEIFMGPHTSPYFVCDAWEDNRGATAAEMVAAMAANEALATSEPIDVSIGGLTGKQFDVQLDPGWTDSCPATRRRWISRPSGLGDSSSTAPIAASS